MEKSEILDLLRYVVDPEERTSLYHQLYPETTKLSVAENVLLYDSMRKHVFEKVGIIEEKDIKYAPSYGGDDFRQMTAALLARAFGMPEMELLWVDLFGVAGVSAALECLAFALFQPGDTVIAPAPCWQGFKWCFEQRPRVNFKPFDLTGDEQDKFKLTLRDVQAAYTGINPKPKALVLTNPHNPLGINYDKPLLEAIYNWVLTNTQMHIISDEMYCHSQVAGADPPFVSAFALQAYRTASLEQKQRVHVVWGFAKDFGLSGFKAGVVISSSPKVHEALKGNQARGITTMAWFSPIDSLKHFMLKKLLSAKVNGELYTTAAMKEYKELLTGQFNTIEKLLYASRISYYRPTPTANPAQFFWLDLREFLPNAAPGCKEFPNIDARECELFNYIREKAEVLLLPGQTLSCKVPGFFRLCFTAEHLDKVTKAVERLAEELNKRRRP